MADGARRDLRRSATPCAADAVRASARRRDAPTRRPSRSSRVQPLWTVQYRIVLITLDICAIIVATILGLRAALRRRRGPSIDSQGYWSSASVIAVGWIVALQYCGGYEIRHLATGPEEVEAGPARERHHRQPAGDRLLRHKTPVARGYVIGVIPLGSSSSLSSAPWSAASGSARRDRGSGRTASSPSGTSDSVRHLLDVTERAKGAGLQASSARASRTRAVGTNLRRASRCSAACARRPSGPARSTPTSSRSPAAASARRACANSAGSSRAPAAGWSWRRP